LTIRREVAVSACHQTGLNVGEGDDYAGVIITGSSIKAARTTATSSKSRRLMPKTSLFPMNNTALGR